MLEEEFSGLEDIARATAVLKSRNESLFDQLKQTESQLDKMNQHWRNLRTKESTKKKERAIKISKGELQKRRRRTA